MKTPTSEEIRAANECLQADGPGAASTITLGILALSDPVLSRFIDLIIKNLGSDADFSKLDTIERSLVLRGGITGAVMGGLNLGVRIGEARAVRRTEFAMTRPSDSARKIARNFCSKTPITEKQEIGIALLIDDERERFAQKLDKIAQQFSAGDYTKSVLESAAFLFRSGE